MFALWDHSLLEGGRYSVFWPDYSGTWIEWEMGLRVHQSRLLRDPVKMASGKHVPWEQELRKKKEKKTFPRIDHNDYAFATVKVTYAFSWQGPTCLH